MDLRSPRNVRIVSVDVVVACIVGDSVIGSCFFFSSRRRHTRSLCDWSSDVCSSDLSYSAGLLRLKKAGLESIPGGGAEIFDEGLRKEIDRKSVV